MKDDENEEDIVILYQKIATKKYQQNTGNSEITKLSRNIFTVRIPLNFRMKFMQYKICYFMLQKCSYCLIV